MSVRTELAADLANAIALYGQTFEWNGTTYACVRNSASGGLDFTDGGSVDDGTETILVALALFPDAQPQIGDGIDADTLQIKRIDPNADNLILTVGSFDA